MKRLLLVSASILVITLACKTSKNDTNKDIRVDTVKVELPLPASDNPSKYDSLKHELNKRRQQKKKK